VTGRPRSEPCSRTSSPSCGRAPITSATSSIGSTTSPRATAFTSGGSAPDRWKRWKEALRRLRYPRLAAREQAFRDAARALDLGRGASVVPPSNLEGGVVTVTVRIASTDDVADHVERLMKAQRNGAWSRLFDVLG
jgi:hypothetical protein